MNAILYFVFIQVVNITSFAHICILSSHFIGVLSFIVDLTNFKWVPPMKSGLTPKTIEGLKWRPPSLSESTVVLSTIF